MPMEKIEKHPLGYLDLESGPKPIYPMNDIFLNYTFDKAENWETLRMAVNIILSAFIESNPKTTMKTIGPILEVITQYQYFLNAKSSTRNQDFKVHEVAGDMVFIEFQNSGFPSLPVRIRSVEYFGLGIGHNRGKLANQIWFLAEDISELLQGNAFARYVLKDEYTNANHPHSSGILYVSLRQLAKKAGDAGQLAQFFLGRTVESPSEVVAEIMTVVNSSFTAFKQDKEVESAMTIKEHWELEAKAEAKAEGRAEGEAALLEKLAAFIEKGLAPNEILSQLQQA